MTARGGDAGSVTALTASVLGGLMLMSALVAGGSAVLRARSDAFGLAAGAARAGAQQLDEDALMRGGLEVDPAAAAEAAQGYLAARDAEGDVAVVGADVIVTVEDSVAIPQLGETVAVSATATVSAVRGTAP
jgi:hypothetical protein